VLIVAETYGTHAKDLQGLGISLAVVFCLAGVYMTLLRHDAPYGLTLLWALVAVAGAHRNKATRWVCYTSVFVVGLCTVLAFTRRRPTELIVDSDDEEYSQSLLESRGSRTVEADGRGADSEAQ
jgi:hypothetical protein